MEMPLADRVWGLCATRVQSPNVGIPALVPPQLIIQLLSVLCVWVFFKSDPKSVYVWLITAYFITLLQLPSSSSLCPTLGVTHYAEINVSK